MSLLHLSSSIPSSSSSSFSFLSRNSTASSRTPKISIQARNTQASICILTTGNSASKSNVSCNANIPKPKAASLLPNVANEMSSFSAPFPTQSSWDVSSEMPEDDEVTTLGSGFDDEGEGFMMAVPKKRTSYTKKRIRKNVWKRKGYQAALKALSLAKSIATGNSKSFFVTTNKE